MMVSRFQGGAWKSVNLNDGGHSLKHGNWGKYLVFETIGSTAPVIALSSTRCKCGHACIGLSSISQALEGSWIGLTSIPLARGLLGQRAPRTCASSCTSSRLSGLLNVVWALILSLVSLNAHHSGTS